MTSHGEPSLDGQLSVVLVDAKNFDERERDTDTDRVDVMFHWSHVSVVVV